MKAKMTSKEVVAYENGRMAYVKEKDFDHHYAAVCPYFHGSMLYHYWLKGHDDEESEDSK